MTTNDSASTLIRVHNQPSSVSPNGPCQPPRNRTVVSAHSTTMPAYSASRNRPKRMPVYSVYGPRTSSESATGMSNGGRRSSASPATKNTAAPIACQGSHHHRHASTMPGSDSVPAAIAADEAANTMGSSYDSSWAATRMPPSRLYLFALAQPAMIAPSTATPIIASAKKSPRSRLRATWSPGPIGTTTRTTRYGTSATAGASANTHRSAAAGA